MAMPTTRARAGASTSSGGTTGRSRVRADESPATILGTHPPTVGHVNNCDECRAWVLAFMMDVSQRRHRV